MRHSPALDGIRAFAVGLVVLFHSKAPLVAGGFLGVDIFFVISGFLITTLITQEYNSKGNINLKLFYAKRALRLTPALFLMLLLYLTFSSLYWPEYEHHFRDALVAAAYLSDYGYAFSKIPLFLSHTWSLSVEAHYYLTYPFLMAALLKLSLKKQLIILALLYLTATAWRFHILDTNGWQSAYYRFDTRLSGFLAGAIASVIYNSGKNESIKPSIGLAALAAISFSIYNSSWGNPRSLTIWLSMTEIASVIIIIYSFQSSIFHKLLSCSPLAYLGKISYGIYLFHYPVIVYLRNDMNWVLTMAYGGGIAVLMAAISYHALERRVRVIKSKQL